MRKLTVNTFLTVDGVMQAPGGPDEDPTGGFEHGGWSAGYWDDQMGQIMTEAQAKPFALLLGRKTYQIFASYWPHATDNPGAAPLNNATKYVASKTLRSVVWRNSQLLKGDVAKAVEKLKKEDGPEIQVHGSSDLIQTLLKHNLIDELRLWVFPLVLGTGKGLFGNGTIPAGLRAVDSTISSTGVVITTYERAEGIRYGSFDLEDSAEAERQHEALREIWEGEGAVRGA